MQSGSIVRSFSNFGGKVTITKFSGIIVPGGFDKRGIEGMIAACRYARENNVPYLGT